MNYNIEGYTFLKNLDSYGGDLKHFKIEKNFNEIVKICNNDEKILGFNTLGYIKTQLNDFDELIFLADVNNILSGLFVKNSFYNKNYKNFFNKIDCKIICINLERRQDRKKDMIDKFENNNIRDYNFYNAVDGQKLTKSFHLLNLFKGNDFFYRKGVLGAALSHLNIYKELLEDNLNNIYLILEDDIEFCDNFNKKLIELINKIKNIKWEVIFLGYHTFSSNLNNTINNEELIIKSLNKEKYVGGFFGYLINKEGVKNTLQYINKVGIKRAIDMAVIDNPNLIVLECYPQLIYSKWVDNINNKVDSDIQRDFNTL